MRGRMLVAWVTAVALMLLLGPTAGAATQDAGRLSRRSGPVTWTGSFTAPNPVGCGRRGGDLAGCERRRLVVDAPAGTWITVSVEPASANVDVTTEDGAEVAQNGVNLLRPDATGDTRHAQVTFQQVRSGAVAYLVGASTTVAPPTTPVSDSSRFTGHAALAGSSFDRAPDCVQAPPERAPAVPADTSRRLPLRIRLVSAAADRPLIQREGAYLVEAYRRIGIDVRISLDTMDVPNETDARALINAVRARYAGTRPPGTDVVYLATDNFAGGGFALCIGGVAYPELAFAVGALHYKANGSVPVSYVQGGLIAAHEIGHLLGGQHHYATCGVGADLSAPGTGGPCSVMFPAAVGASGGFSPVETAFLRDYTGRFANRA